MDEANCELACGLVSSSYIEQGKQSIKSRSNLVKALLSSRRLPEEGWDELTIERLLQVGHNTLPGHTLSQNLSLFYRSSQIAISSKIEVI